MWKRRLVYLLILLATYIFFIFYRMWVAWYLLLLVIVLSLASLLACVVSFIKFNPTSQMPETLKHNDIAQLKMGETFAKNADKSLLYCNYQAKFILYDSLENLSKTLFYSSNGRKDFEVSIDTSHVGKFEYTFDSIKYYDFLGLFCFKKKINKRHSLLIRPRPLVPEIIPRLDEFRTRSLKKSKSQYSEIYDIRDYQPGDSTKNIHWKMSAKKDSVLVREPLEENLENARIVFELVKNRDLLDKKISELIYISDYFIKKGISHRINVVPPFNRDVHFEIYSESDIGIMIDKILDMKLPSADKEEVSVDAPSEENQVENSAEQEVADGES